MTFNPFDIRQHGIQLPYQVAGPSMRNGQRPFTPMQQPIQLPQFGGMQSMPTPPGMLDPQQGGGNWLTGGLKKAGNWLGQDDNAIQLAGLGLGAYGAYKQGKAQDDQVREERRRREEELEGKREAAKRLQPLIDAMMAQAMRGA